MDLSEQQVDTIREQAKNGAQLSDLQSIIQNDFGKSITYMETRFLISDLGIEIVTPKAAEPTPSTVLDSQPSPSTPTAENPGERIDGDVSVSIDDVQHPGALISGSVTWSDGETGLWMVNESGGLDMRMEDATYQPTQADIETFQSKLRALIDGQM